MLYKLCVPLAGMLCLQATVYAQTDTSRLQDITLNEFVFSGNKFSENKKNIAQPLQLITRKQIMWCAPQTSATMLEQSGNVFVQRSQMGGGSAVIRGFEANKVLMVVDGVRMNNAIYRGGHLQNVITLDNNILDRVEILYGPASTLYGSDALGGVIAFTTRDPQFSVKKDEGMHFGAHLMTRYSSANNEGTGHIDFDLGFKKIAFLTSVTYSKFGDLRQGNYRNPFYNRFGLRDNYVARVDGVDSIFANGNPNVQKSSGYSQVDLLEKIVIKQNDRISHSVNIQYSTSSDIPRYDRLTDKRNGQLRWAEWYYGPQERLLAAYQLKAEKLYGFFDEILAGVNYQAIEESRHQRQRGNNVRESRTENVGVAGYYADFRKLMRRHELTIGTDGQYNDVKSEGSTYDLVSGATGKTDTRYPDGGSNMFYASLYAQHIYKIVADKLILNDGLRLNYVSLHARFRDKTFFPFPYNEASQQQTAWSGNLGLVYLPAKKWRFALSGSTGFRAPNIDDLGKVFESAGGAYLVVPNPDLKPEYTYNADLGITYLAGNTLKLEANGYYTWLRQAIVQSNFTLNGMDSLLYDGKQTQIVANQNKARAFLYGFNAAITAHLMPEVTLHSTINYTFGRYYGANDVQVPLDHVSPVFGKTSITYHHQKFRGEVYALYNGWKWLKDYSPTGEDNLQYATPEGMPAWYTLNVRAGLQFENVSLQAAIENLLDYNYRVFSSGISAPGRNFVLTIRGNL